MFTPFDAGGPGDMFVASPQWKAIADPSSRGQSWTTGPVDVGMLTKAGTLLESGQGAGAVPVPQVVPGIVPTLFQPLGIADIFQQGIATTSSIRYVNEGTATSGAAGVAEGATKPASDIAVATHRERRLTTRKVRRHHTLLTSDFRGFGRREPGYWRYPVAPLLGPPRCAFIVPALRGVRHIPISGFRIGESKKSGRRHQKGLADGRKGISCSPRRFRHPAVRYGLRDCLMLSVPLSWMASVAQMAQVPLGFRRRRVKEPGAFRRCVRRCHPRTRRRCEAMERLGGVDMRSLTAPSALLTGFPPATLKKFAKRGKLARSFASLGWRESAPPRGGPGVVFPRSHRLGALRCCTTSSLATLLARTSLATYCCWLQLRNG